MQYLIWVYATSFVGYYMMVGIFLNELEKEKVMSVVIGGMVPVLNTILFLIGFGNILTKINNK